MDGMDSSTPKPGSKSRPNSAALRPFSVQPGWTSRPESALRSGRSNRPMSAQQVPRKDSKFSKADIQPSQGINEEVAILQRADIFKGCNSTFLTKLLETAEIRNIEAGETIDFGKCNAMLFVQRGALDMCVEGGAIVTVGPGSLMNVLGMLGETESEFLPEKSRSDKDRERKVIPHSYDIEGYMGRQIHIYSDRQGCMDHDHIAEDVKAWGLSENQRCLFSLCPNAAAIDEGSQRESSPRDGSPTGGKATKLRKQISRVGGRSLGSGEEMDLAICGSDPGQIPANGGNEEDFVDGGASVYEFRLKDIQAIVQKARPDATDEREGADMFKSNWKPVCKMRSRILRLASRTLFPGAPAEFTWGLAEIAQAFSVDAGEKFVIEGSRGFGADDIILIEQGVAAVEKTVNGKKKEPLLIGKLREGAIIGDLCLMGSNFPRAAAVVSKTRLEGLRLPSHEVLDLLQQFPGVLSAPDLRRRLLAVAFMMKGSQAARVEIIASLHLFRQFDMSLLHEIARLGSDSVYSCGDTVIEEGATDCPVCVLTIGECDVEVLRAGKVAVVPTGNSFGESSFLGIADQANATVRVASPFAMVLEMKTEDILQVMEEYPQAKALLEELRMTPVEGRVKGMGFGLVRLFKQCKPAFIDMLSAGVYQCSYLPGQTLCVQDTTDDDPAMYMITGGSVAVERGDTFLAELMMGSTFGELAMLGVKSERTVTVRALTFCQTALVPRSVFVSTLQEYPDEEEYFKACINNPAAALGKIKWPCLGSAPQALTNLVMLYQDERQCQQDERLHILEKGNAAILVVRGRIAIEDENGTELDMLEGGDCHNVQAMIGYVESSFAKMRFVPRESSEIYLITPAIWANVCAEFPVDTDNVVKEIKDFVADQAKLKLGLTNPIVDVLQFSAIFRYSSEEFCNFFGDHLESRFYAPGDVIIPKHMEGEDMFFCLRGLAESSESDRQVRCVVKPGDVFGESACMGITAYYPSDMKARTFCVAQVLKRQSLWLALQVPAFKFERNMIDQMQEESELVSPQYLQECMVRSTVFNLVEKSFLMLLCHRVELRFYAPGEKIVAKGEECDIGKSDIYICCAGKIQAEGANGVLFGTICKGEAIGEAGAFGVSKVRTATARAKRSGGIVVVASISGVVIGAALRSHPRTVDTVKDLFKKREQTNKQIQEQRRLWIAQTVVPTLLKCPLLSGCPQEFLEAVALTLNEKIYIAGDTVAKIGSEDASMLVVLHGVAEVQSRTGERICYLKEGATFGEIAALGLFSGRMASIKALSPCRIMFVTNQALSRALGTPAGKDMALGFEQLVQSRREQVLCGLPLSCLPVSIPVNNPSVRTIALVSERIILNPGEAWTPLSDHCPAGPHIGILAAGRAVLELSKDGQKELMQFTPGSILLEGMLAEFGACVRAQTYCECYRIRESEFLMAIPSSSKDLAQPAQDWFWRFKLYMKEESAKIHRRLEGGAGMVDCITPSPKDTEIMMWTRARRERLVQAKSLNKERRERSVPVKSHFKALTSSTSRLPALASGAKTRSQVEFNKGIKAYPGVTTMLPNLEANYDNRRRGSGALGDTSGDSGSHRGMRHSRSEPFISSVNAGNLQAGGAVEDDGEERVLSRPGSVAGRVEQERRVSSAGRMLPV